MEDGMHGDPGGMTLSSAVGVEDRRHSDESRGARGSRRPRRCKSSAAEREGGRGGRRGRIGKRVFGDLDDRGGRKQQERGLILVVGDDDVVPWRRWCLNGGDRVDRRHQ
jgi:hypothetical protein